MKNNEECRKSIVNSYKLGHPSGVHPTTYFIENQSRQGRTSVAFLTAASQVLLALRLRGPRHPMGRGAIFLLKADSWLHSFRPPSRSSPHGRLLHSLVSSASSSSFTQRQHIQVLSELFSPCPTRTWSKHATPPNFFHYQALSTTSSYFFPLPTQLSLNPIPNSTKMSSDLSIAKWSGRYSVLIHLYDHGLES